MQEQAEMNRVDDNKVPLMDDGCEWVNFINFLNFLKNDFDQQWRREAVAHT